MTQPVPLTSGLGEVLAPQMMVTALILGPDGQGKFDAGALHGRSELESQLSFVEQRALVADGQPHWMVWVAIQLDVSNLPVRYHGLSVSELWIDPKRRIGYKSVAGQVNRMAEAMRGDVKVSVLTPALRRAVRQYLTTLNQTLWASSSEALKKALE